MENSQHRCRVCNSTSLNNIFVARDSNRRDLFFKFQYLKCCKCSAIFLAEIPKNLEDYYSGDYPAYEKRYSPSVERQISSWELDKLNIVCQHASGGRLLEVGPAAGRFLSVAKAAGFSVVALERDANCCHHIESKIGVEVYQCDDPVSVFNRIGKFDVIAAWHVIEHLSELREFLMNLSAITNPNGIVVFSTPNPNSLSFRIFGRNWVHLDAPRHIQLIPIIALDQIMLSVGYRLVTSYSNDLVGEACDRMGWLDSMSNAFLKIYLKSRVFRVFSRICASVLRTICSPIEKYFLCQSTYTAVYRYSEK